MDIRNGIGQKTRVMELHKDLKQKKQPNNNHCVPSMQNTRSLDSLDATMVVIVRRRMKKHGPNYELLQRYLRTVSQVEIPDLRNNPDGRCQ
jgi:hypothetical protein